MKIKISVTIELSSQILIYLIVIVAKAISSAFTTEGDLEREGRSLLRAPVPIIAATC